METRAGFTFKQTADGAVLTKYTGEDQDLRIPSEYGGKPVTAIGDRAFTNCYRLRSAVIPDSVRTVGSMAFVDCPDMTSIVLPDTVEKIGYNAFAFTGYAFDPRNWEGDALYIGRHLVQVKESVSGAFEIRPGTLTVAEMAFTNCLHLDSVTVPEGVTRLEMGLFVNCNNLNSVLVPDSVKAIHAGSFDRAPHATVVCREGSYAHRRCVEKQFPYIFDYQFKAFGGVIPPGVEKLESPFEADEETPFAFISYSHKDRAAVLPILKPLYESGWRIWYDEGLTIGDRYDRTLEEHVKKCGAFLLFVTEHMPQSAYIRDNEIPWAIQYGRPIVLCVLDDGVDCEIREDTVTASVFPEGIGSALETAGVRRGDPRKAKGISAAVDPAARERPTDGFAYCLYSEDSAQKARAILLEAGNGGCSLYDAVQSGEDPEKLRTCACLILFLDRSAMSDPRFTEVLLTRFRPERDVLCWMDDSEGEDLPKELRQLDGIQGIRYTREITPEQNTRLIRHLQKRGCRNVTVIPGFTYITTDRGIRITRYTGLNPFPKLEEAYGGVPVIEIGHKAFKNCACLKAITLPAGVKRIGAEAFANCPNLSSVVLSEGVEEIEAFAFSECAALTSVTIPDSVTEMGFFAFIGCSGLSSVRLSAGLKELPVGAFSGCDGLTAAAIPDGVTEIGVRAFENCRDLIEVRLPDSLKAIGKGAFKGCSSLESVILPDGLETIGESAFETSGLRSVAVPGSVKTIGDIAFRTCVFLRSVALSPGTTEIGEGAFSYTMIDSVTVPEGVTAVSYGAFCGCTALSSVTLPDSVKSIEEMAFYGCGSLESIRIPDGVTVIGKKAFSGCRNLSSVTLPDSVKRIGEKAFFGCGSLKSIRIPDGVESINASAFPDPYGMTILGSPGSYAQQFAQIHRISFRET